MYPDMYPPGCLLLSLVFCGYFSDVQMNIFGVSHAELTPVNPVFEEGETIVLNCTLTSHFNGTQNSSLLAFKHNGVTFGSEFIRCLSPETAQLQIPNATHDHYGFFVCFLLPNHSLGLGAVQDVNVARRPRKPDVTQCHVFNWESLKCSWTPSREEQKDLSWRNLIYTTALWHEAGTSSEVCRRNVSEDRFILERDAKANFTSCNFVMGRNYVLQIEVANIIRKPVLSTLAYINTSDIVWPNPPQDVAYSFSGNGTQLLLNWNPPTSRVPYYPQQLTYSLSYQSKWNQTVVMSLNETSIVLSSIPFTSYSIGLRVKPSPLGYWSNETTLQFLTPSTFPCQQPDINSRGFTVTSLTSVKRIVTIYWKPVPEREFCGKDFHYVVSMRSSGSWSVLDTPILDCSTEIPIGPDETLVHILAKNKEGISSKQQDVVRIPSFPTPSPVEEVVVEINTQNLSYASIHWDYSSSNPNITSAAIFWCISSTGLPEAVKCKNSIQWKDLDTKQREFGLTSDSDVNLIRVGVSVELSGINSGIKWSAAVYALDKVAPAPEKLEGVVPYGADHGHVHVVWKRPECHYRFCGHVDEYILFYCISAESEGCVGNSNNVSIASNQFAYNLTNLNSGSRYRLWMVSSSKAGLSKSSVAITVNIAKPWKSAGTIVGIAIAALITVMIAVCGLYGIYKCCHKYEKKITRGVEIVLPRSVPVSKVVKTSSSSEAQILYNCYPNGYHRQVSDMSTVSRDSGRFSLTNPCTTSTVMVLQQMSPLISKPNGTLMASTVTPLIGIQEDGASDDVFPEVHGLDGNNYVKTIVIEDPDNSSGYKVIRTVDSYRAENGMPNTGQHPLRNPLTKQPEVWVCSSSPNCTSLPPDDVLFPKAPVVLRATNDADNCPYIRIAPGTNFDDVSAFYKSPQVAPFAAAPSVPPPVPISVPTFVPPSGNDISYTTVEMLNPSFSVPPSISPDGGCVGNTVENGYTDLTFLTNSLLSNGNRANGAAPHLELGHLGACPSEVDNDLSQRLSHPYSAEKTLANAELNGNNNADFNSLIDPLKNCFEVPSSDENHAQFTNNLDSHSVSSSTQSDFSLSKEHERENCTNVMLSSVPGQCDNGYILHADLIGNV